MARKQIVLSLMVLCCLVGLCSSHSETPRLLVISFDGFRWDYLDNIKKTGRPTPHFDMLIAGGVTIDNDGPKNAFITKTLPDHYTIATGLYEEDHGVVANWFFDPEFNQTFDSTSPDGLKQKWWDGKSGNKHAEPIWMTNEQHKSELSGPRYSGVFFWPGSDVEGQRPTFFQFYNKSVPFKTRVETVGKWFTQEEKQITFGMLYFEDPDHTGHMHGPNSPEVFDKIVELDGLLGELIGVFEDHKMFHGINIIVTSDHGMSLLNKIVYLDDYLNSSLYRHFGGSPVWNILPNLGQEDVVYEALKLGEKDGLIVYRKKEIPDEYHYKHNRRIQPIVVTAQEGVRICQFRNSSDCGVLLGDHGYNNSLKSMHPIFIAHGPAFKKDYKTKSFNTVDLYPLMCRILGVKPNENDGNLDEVKNILAEEEDLDLGATLLTYLFLIGFVAMVAGIYCIAACRGQRIYSPHFTNLQMIKPTGSFEGKKPLLISEDEDEDFA